MTRYYPDLHDKSVRHLFQCMLSDQQIAERMGMSWQTIRRARQRLGLGLPRKDCNVRRPAEPLPPQGMDENNPLVAARITLGKRLEERTSGYFLDGVPVSAPDMVREANRVRAANGQDQVGPPNWRVKP
ncbi:hypothetical protein [Zavarzinella formosa]|uniref:hypothetical protein n=1 Tax=Zavarzinella formosa TaxID=360055 RepID=UPI0002E9AB2C|nr:hypothetical protein [Zavarzinella formosa]